VPTWIPVRESDRLVWLQNFNLKIGLYVGTASITAGDVTLVGNWLATYLWIINRAEQIRTVSQDLTTWKSIFADGPEGAALGAFPTAPVYPATPPLFTPTAGMFLQLVRMAERIRNSAGYTQAIGEDLGIVPPGGGGGPLPDPVIELIALPNSEVRVNWVKGRADSIIIESQRAGETTWTLLGTDSSSPYLDSRAPLVAGQPEVRRYRVRYVVNDEPVGNYSAVASVTTVP
jgi:hypothetical protein